MRISDWSSDVCSSDLPLIQSSRTNCRCPGSPIRRACLEEVASNFLKTEILHRYLQNPSPSNWSLSGKFKDSHKNGPQLGRPRKRLFRNRGQPEQLMFNKVVALIQELKQDCGTRLSISNLKRRSEEQTSELQQLMRIPYAVFCLNKKT